jgi:hypothetical protein
MKFKKYLPAIIIALATIIVWGKTVSQVFMGEGYIYFDTGLNFSANGKIIGLERWDNFGRILFDALPPIFHDNISYYLAFQILIIIVITIVFYYLVKYFTKNTWISLSSAVIFCTSYLGLFEMIGTGNYERFAQRIPNLIPQLLAFLLLAKYFDTKKIKHYIYSLILFSLSIFMGHFSTFLMPTFVIYPIIFSIVHKSRVKKIIINILLSIPFVLLNLFLISGDIFTPKGDFIGFIKENGIGHITSQIILQISNMTLPPLLIEKIASVTSSYQSTLLIMTLPIVFIFFIGLYIIRRKQKKIIIIYALSLFSLFILLFLNLYLGKVNPMHNMTGYTYYFLPTAYSSDPSLTASLKGDRYYMLPYFFISIIASTLIYSLIKNKKAYRLFSIIFLTGCIFYNCSLVWKNIQKIQPVSEDLKKYLSFVKTISPKLNNQSIIVVPREFLWPSLMIRAIYNYPEIKFLPNDIGWKQQITNSKNLLLIDFYYDMTKDGKINVSQNRVIDLTDWTNYNLPKK